MAEASGNTSGNFQSVEVDTAPSVGYLNLDNLDIGSECEIKTEPKLHGCKPEQVNVATSQGNSAGNFKTVDVLTERNGEGNLETGLGSLNLGEEVESEVDIDENVSSEDVLLHQDNDGDILLHTAILFLWSHLACELCVLMQDMGVTLDIRNHLHQTPLHLAVLTNQPEVVKCLLLSGASIFQRDNKLRTPMLIACEDNNMEMLEVLFHYSNFCLPDLEASSKLLNPNANPLDLPNADGERCLHLAARHNNTEMAGKLIENGADPNLPDRKSGRTALHEAAELGHVEMVRYLVSREEVDVNECTYNDETALEIAHMRGRGEVVSLLKHKSLPMTKRKSKTDISASTG